MTDMFAEREKAFEDKWAHDEELKFKLLARRNHLLGLWAAGEMGLKGAAAENYAKAIIRAQVVKEDNNAVVRRIATDFKAAKIARTEHLIRRKMQEYLAAAEAQAMDKSKRK